MCVNCTNYQACYLHLSFHLRLHPTRLAQAFDSFYNSHTIYIAIHYLFKVNYNAEVEFFRFYLEIARDDLNILGNTFFKKIVEFQTVLRLV